MWVWTSWSRANHKWVAIQFILNRSEPILVLHVHISFLMKTSTYLPVYLATLDYYPARLNTFQATHTSVYGCHVWLSLRPGVRIWVRDGLLFETRVTPNRSSNRTDYRYTHTHTHVPIHIMAPALHPCSLRLCCHCHRLHPLVCAQVCVIVGVWAYLLHLTAHMRTHAHANISNTMLLAPTPLHPPR